MDIRNLQAQINQAITAREAGDLEKSRQLFETLLPEITKLGKSSDSHELDLYNKFTGEWIIQHRHEGKQAFLQALDMAETAYTKNPDHPAIIRGYSNTLIDNGEYEEAEKYLYRLLARLPDDDSAKKGDTFAHLAKLYLRTGRITEALETIDTSLELLQSNPYGHPRMHLAVWKSHAFRIKAIVSYDLKNLPQAKKYITISLAEAKQFNLKIRIQEAERTLRFLNHADSR